jgi:hypothetical protein
LIHFHPTFILLFVLFLSELLLICWAYALKHSTIAMNCDMKLAILLGYCTT